MPVAFASSARQNPTDFLCFTLVRLIVKPIGTMPLRRKTLARQLCDCRAGRRSILSNGQTCPRTPSSADTVAAARTAKSWRRVMPSMYEIPGTRRNVYYWPKVTVAAGRLHPDKRIEPRIARTGAKQKKLFLLRVLIRDLRVKAVGNAPSRPPVAVCIANGQTPGSQIRRAASRPPRYDDGVPRPGG